jgi:hypothetical protein
MRSATEEAASKNTLRWGNTGALTFFPYLIVKAGNAAETRIITKVSQIM